MQYRALDSNGDYIFGKPRNSFLSNSPAAVAQAVKTRLSLITGEWFLDTTEGTPYMTDVLGTGTQATYDMAIKARVLGTEGVSEIADYASTRNREDRTLSVAMTLNTIYGQTTVEQVL